eukprot:gnl/Chilomastix_cuspidata/571.p1 GENE.gnl/Chilomastix_cuspidata/571~~gnl/Chilomastix_cuspidata/571.p1  ORF type:complete len:490 (+),score=170.95 gnl/Chilomastix_cuspidata/571:27-1496(+)
MLLKLVFFVAFFYCQCEEPLFDLPSSQTAAHQVSSKSQVLTTYINAVSSQAIDALLAFDVPDIDGTASTSIGEIEYSFSDIIFQDADFGNLSITTDAESSSFNVYTESMYCDVDLSYAVQLLSWPYIDDEGTGTLSFSNITLSGSSSFFRDPSTGDLEFSFNYFTTTIGVFSIDFTGGIVAALIDLLSDILADSLNVVISDIINEVVLEQLEVLFTDNSFLSWRCRGGVCLDLRLARDPTIEEAYVSQLYGGTYYVEDDQSTYAAPTDFTSFPMSLNEQDIQTFFGPACFTSYFQAIYDAGEFEDEIANVTYTDEFASAFPEFANAFPGEDATLSFSMQSAADVFILYSALQVELPVALTIAPRSTGVAAVEFSLRVITAGDVDFADRHGDDAPITGDRNHLSIELSPYDIEGAVAWTDIGSVLLSDTLLAWIEDEFFAAARVDETGWQSVLDAIKFQELTLENISYLDRKLIYDPDYFAITFDIIIQE